MDTRFDLTHAYFLINGIAGVDPKYASIGSAAWAKYVVSDVAREIDPREAPKDWPYGIFPVKAHEPNPKTIPSVDWFKSNTYPLNPALADWAYGLTKGLSLGDDPVVAKFRAGFVGYPEGQRPPFVLIGDTFASDYYWHGKIMTGYAEDWVKLYTQGKGTFVMTEMEDSGFMEAIDRLTAMKKVDPKRVMVLRTGSNYSMQRPGHEAIESVTAPYIGSKLALESAYLCGSTVLHEILGHWRCDVREGAGGVDALRAHVSRSRCGARGRCRSPCGDDNKQARAAARQICCRKMRGSWFAIMLLA